MCRGRQLINKYRVWLMYTMMFGVTFLLTFWCFFAGDYSFVIWGDGVTQQYSSLLYFHRWGREVIEQLMSTGQLNLKLWDLNLGLGSDIFTTIFYYVSVPPITLGAILCPEKWLEYFYDFEFVFRLYLAGVCFVAYARSRGNEELASVLGSMAYCFCGFVLQKGSQHTFFVMAMALFPLMLWGVDKILKKKSPVLFVVSTAWSAITNFYFFYMTVIIVVIYAISQIYFINPKATLKELILWIFKFALYGLIAVCISGFIFLPTAYAMLGSDRVGNAAEIPPLYSLSYYFQLFWGSATNDFRDYDTRTGYLIPTLASVFLLWSKKGNRQLKFYWVVLTVFLCIPYLGSVMNGFGYVSNRWIFMYSFLLSYILTAMVPEFAVMEKTQVRRLFLLVGIWLLGIILIPLMGINNERQSLYRTGLYLMAFWIGVSLLLEAKKAEKWMLGFLTFIVAINVALNRYYEFAPTQSNYIGNYVSRGDVLEEYTDKLSSNQLKQVEDIQLYRSDVTGSLAENRNSYMRQGIPGGSFTIV